MQKLKKGFTLIELLVVIAIIAILATIVIINIAAARGKANNSKALDAMNVMQKTAALCVAEEGQLTTGTGAIPLVSGAAGIPLVATGRICTLASVPGSYPVLSGKSSNGNTWTRSTGAFTYTTATGVTTFDFKALAGTAAGAVGDFRITCDETHCYKEECTVAGAYQSATINW